MDNLFIVTHLALQEIRQYRPEMNDLLRLFPVAAQISPQSLYNARSSLSSGAGQVGLHVDNMKFSSQNEE
jgi:hypothetical protein